MNTHSSIVLLSLLFLTYFCKSTPCSSRCGSSWTDADNKCGECCQFPSDCSTPGDNCFAGCSLTPCQGSQLTPSPTSSTPASTPSTPSPTSSTPSPIQSQVTPAPTDNTPSPTSNTLSPTNITPSPVTSTSCTIRCGSNWHDAFSKCGQCCQSRSDCSTSSDNCFGGLSLAACAPTSKPTPKPTSSLSLPTASPVFVPTAATSAPIDGNTIGNYRLAVISGCGSGKYVSLTFDDGPAEQNDATLTIINKLNAQGIVATFYVSPAAWGEDQWGLDKRCNLIKQLIAGGNEIQSHSWKHPNFKDTALNNSDIKEELDTTSDFIVECGGTAPTIFRPPYGALNKQQAEYIVRELRYIIGLWNLDSNDWRSPNDFHQISANINLNLYEGDSINILMHDRNVYDIVDDVINLFKNGYQFITQSECYKRCDTIDSDGVCMDTHGQNLFILNQWRSQVSSAYNVQHQHQDNAMNWTVLFVIIICCLLCIGCIVGSIFWWKVKRKRGKAYFTDSADTVGNGQHDKTEMIEIDAKIQDDGHEIITATNYI